MNIPGFNAEASLYHVKGLYSAIEMIAQTPNAVLPQICNLDCLDNCASNCLDPGDCVDLPPKYQAACRRAAIACLTRCRRRCCH